MKIFKFIISWLCLGCAWFGLWLSIFIDMGGSDIICYTIPVGIYIFLVVCDFKQKLWGKHPKFKLDENFNIKYICCKCGKELWQYEEKCDKCNQRVNWYRE